jgi:hypothetical protein
VVATAGRVNFKELEIPQDGYLSVPTMLQGAADEVIE